MNSMVKTRKGEVVQDPPLVKWLTSHPLAGLLWLPLRLYLGWQWLEAGLHKLENPAWVQTGEALKGYWTNAIAIPDAGRPPISFDWYRSFLTMLLNSESYHWFAPLIAYGELLIGIALILGIFTGIAAFMGGFMNWNFMMAGSASTNPVLFALAIGLVLAWKVGGYVGVDRFLLPMLGTPWQGQSVQVKKAVAVPASGD